MLTSADTLDLAERKPEEPIKDCSPTAPKPMPHRERKSRRLGVSSISGLRFTASLYSKEHAGANRILMITRDANEMNYLEKLFDGDQ